MKILIVGSGPNWREAPFEDSSFEVWTYGLIADLMPRVDVAFEMHRRDRWEAFAEVDSEVAYVKRLNALGKAVFMQEVYPDIPGSVEYPLTEVETLVGSQFFSTIAYELGYAAFLQASRSCVEQILLFGLDLCTWDEWAYQRPNVNRLIGYLQGMGVDVRVPASSQLFGRPFRYGYDLPDELPEAVDALIVEGLGQLSAMMARMADLHIAKKEAVRFTKNGSGK